MAVRLVHIDDVEFLLDCHPRMTVEELAPRFGVVPNSIQTALGRAKRFDLLDRLARNSALAGHNVSRRRAS